MARTRLPVVSRSDLLASCNDGELQSAASNFVETWCSRCRNEKCVRAR
jgi:hypothetical protein